MSSHGDYDDFPAHCSSAAIGARLRRISERIDQETGQIYRQLHVKFEQRWYGPFNQIRLHEPIGVSEIAGRLGITHAAASQSCSSLLNAGLIAVTTDPQDARRRPLLVTAAGQSLAQTMDPIWIKLDTVSQQLAAEACGLLVALEGLEKALDRQSIGQRLAKVGESAAD
jgi:MarR family transcriptional regulator, organic hydroperoxide resistance regulator